MTFSHEGFEHGEDLHLTYASQISTHLGRVLKRWDPPFEYGVHGNPFVVRRLSDVSTGVLILC